MSRIIAVSLRAASGKVACLAIDALIKPLQALPIFSGLTHVKLGEIVRAAERIMYRPGSVIAAENATSSATIIIISGSCVRLNDELGSFQGEELPLGSMIAELAMLIDVVHPSTIMARDTVRALRINRSQMLTLMEKDLALAEHFSQVLVGRLAKVRDELADIDAVWDSARMPPSIGPTSAPLSSPRAF